MWTHHGRRQPSLHHVHLVSRLGYRGHHGVHVGSHILVQLLHFDVNAIAPPMGNLRVTCVVYRSVRKHKSDVTGGWIHSL